MWHTSVRRKRKQAHFFLSSFTHCTLIFIPINFQSIFIEILSFVQGLLCPSIELVRSIHWRVSRMRACVRARARERACTHWMYQTNVICWKFLVIYENARPSYLVCNDLFFQNCTSYSPGACSSLCALALCNYYTKQESKRVSEWIMSSGFSFRYILHSFFFIYIRFFFYSIGSEKIHLIRRNITGTFWIISTIILGFWSLFMQLAALFFMCLCFIFVDFCKLFSVAVQ